MRVNCDEQMIKTYLLINVIQYQTILQKHIPIIQTFNKR